MILRTLIAFLLIALPSMVFSQSEQKYVPLDNAEMLKAGIAKLAENTTTIKTSFHQKKYLSILSNAISSEGEMVFKKPKALKWAYTKPYNYMIIFHNNEIVINDEGKISEFDISSSKAFVEINDIIVNSVSGNILQEDQFTIEYFESKDYYKAKMYPKVFRMKSYIDIIEVYLDKKDFTVASIKLVEKEKDYTLIDFFDKKLNEPVANEEFEVK
ncbi:MAG TPA: outer membrane lipoprotein carrier protein LolA [Fulvivirga sp.]|nr:outer membrane lipoprotein carrier protein LolA [Fulvivirga sp.]